ncbi:MAG: hexose kinase [Spirochaetia bacterium]|jgi:1-phosphofructokinase family hexose kinase|nr:hexose kinase [Spirochaetia bacterium]
MVKILCLNPTVDRIYYIDDFHDGAQFHGTVPQVFAGGKGVNIARVLHYLGQPSTLYCFLGGMNGNFVSMELQDLSTELKTFPFTGETRTTINVIDNRNRKETEITEAGVIIDAEAQEQFLTALKSELKRDDLVICSGLPMNGMSNDIYRQVSDICAAKGSLCAIDANQRYFQSAFPGNYFFAKPNKNELAQLFGKTGDLTRKETIYLAKQMLGWGVKNVLVSLGADGGIFINDEHVYAITVPDKRVISTIGSGDATVAGFCFGYMHGLSIEDTLAFSMSCGISNAMHNQVGFVKTDEVAQLRAQILLREIKG